MLNITIATIPQKEQDYDTLGDYKGHARRRFIEVSELGDWRWEFLIALHELCEQNMQIALDISEESIVSWDKNHPESDDPGSIPGCPYQDIHLMSESIEKMVCEKSGWSWEEYNKALDEHIRKHWSD